MSGTGGSQAEERKALLGRGSRLHKGRGREGSLCLQNEEGRRSQETHAVEVGEWTQVTNNLPSLASNLKAKGSTERAK